MPVFVVFVRFNIKFLLLATALDLDVFALRFLLRNQTCEAQVAKLELGFDPEKALGTLNQGSTQGHTHVTCFDFFQDIVLSKFLTVVVQFDHLVKIKSCTRIVIGIEVELFPDFSLYVHLNVHVKIEQELVALAQVQDGVFEALIVVAKGEVDITLRLDVDGIPSKQAVDQIFFDVDFAKGIQWIFIILFAPGFGGQFTEIRRFVLFLTVLGVLIKSHV